MNENQILSDQIRAELLRKMHDALKGDRAVLALHLADIESAAHVLYALDPARSSFLTGSYATLKAEQTTS